MVERAGLARFPSTDYKTTNHIIAYLDILGATRLNTFKSVLSRIFLKFSATTFLFNLSSANGSVEISSENLYFLLFYDSYAK